MESQCKAIKDHEFPEALKEFARLPVAMKNKRHKADYHPLERFNRSAVQNELTNTKNALKEFRSVTQAERARFAYFVSLRSRNRS